MANLQTAIATLREIETLRIGPAAAQVRDINEHFTELTANATEYGISLEGVAEAQTKALAEAAVAQKVAAQQERAAFGQVAVSVGAWSDLTGAMHELQLSMEVAKAEADRLGISTDGLAKQQAYLANQITTQSRLQVHAVGEMVGAFTPLTRRIYDLQVQFENAWYEADRLGVSTAHLAQAQREAEAAVVRQWRAQVHAIGQQIGAYTPLERQIGDIHLAFEEAAAQARALGLSTARLNQARHEEVEAVKRQYRAQAHAVGELVGAWMPLERQIGDVLLKFEEGAAAARALGVSTERLNQARHAEIEALKRQHQAQLDAMALSVSNPFEQLLEPLRALGIELDRSLLNPLDQFNAAAQNFRDITARALAGNTEAIQQLDEAGRQFIATAEQVGASPAQAAATREVQNVLQQTMGVVGAAQSASTAGYRGRDLGCQSARGRHAR